MTRAVGRPKDESKYHDIEQVVMAILWLHLIEGKKIDLAKKLAAEKFGNTTRTINRWVKEPNTAEF